MSGTEKPSPEQMLAWLALEGFQAYEGGVCVGVWKNNAAYWCAPDSSDFVGIHSFEGDERTIEYGTKWIGSVYEKPIPNLDKIYKKLIDIAEREAIHEP